MNNLLKMVLGGVLLAITGVSVAECPKNLNADQTYDCIVVEGAGGTYVAPKTSAATSTQSNNETASTDNESVKVAQTNAKK